jgi:hypothetical protein
MGSSTISRLSWAFTAAICLFTIENLWFDARIRRHHQHIPSLVPEAPSGMWLVALGALALALALVLVCQILLMKDARTPGWRKITTGTAALVALGLGAQWFMVTSGAATPTPERKLRAITLKWNVSASKVAGYNVYRGLAPGGLFVRLNKTPVKDLTYTENVMEQSGTRYYYYVRSVSPEGKESVGSTEAIATMP